MTNRPHRLLLAVTLGCLSAVLSADQHVAVTAFAKEEYTQRKFEHGRPRTETYVFMQGKYYEGSSIDRSVEKMSFRRIAEYLAPELAKQQYLPCKDPAAADLLLVVHWGTTIPRLTAAEMRAQTSPTTDMSNTAAGIERQIKEFNEKTLGEKEPPLMNIDTTAVGDDVDRQLEFDGLTQTADQVRSEFAAGTNARLLGYERELYKMGKSMVATAAEDTLRHDLTGERYFIIVRAYDLKEKVEAGQQRRSVWTIYMNIRSPGQNFPNALNLMGIAASDHFGRTTEGVKTTKVSVRSGKVTLAPVIILDDKK